MVKIKNEENCTAKSEIKDRYNLRARRGASSKYKLGFHRVLFLAISAAFLGELCG
jgi:hypothetical protein